MDGIPIKFRGVFIHTDRVTDRFFEKELGLQAGDTVCGGYCRIDNQDCVIVPANNGAYAVPCDDIDQLIGYDSNGAELYDGDEVIIDDSIHDQVEGRFAFCEFPGICYEKIVLKKGGDSDGRHPD